MEKDDSPAPQTPLQAALTFWAHFATLFVGLVGTGVGIYATIQSNNAKTQAAYTTDELQKLQVSLQAANTFANGIHEARDALAQTNASGGIPAMVEVSRLYEVATNVQEKLVLIQIAQLSKQQAAMFALSTLVANDPDLQSPIASDRSAVVAIDRILRNATTQIAESATPPPARTPRTAATPQKGAGRKPAAHPREAPTPQAPSDDPALTSSSNHLVAANAALVASLPKTERQQGWIFAGDVNGWGSDASKDGAQLIQYTSSIAPPVVPLPSKKLIACRDLNIRAVPLSNGTLGAVTGIVPQGTVLTAQSPPAANPSVRSAIPTMSMISGKKITARWVYVTVDPAPPAASPSPAPDASEPSQTRSSATSCTPPAQVPSR